MYKRALLISLLCAAAAVTLLLLYLKRFEQESSGGERVRVLVALQALDRGKQLTEDVLTVREIPQAYVEDRSIREADKSKILGLRVGGLVQAQQTLMWTDLAVASEDCRDLSALVQPGRRAVSIQFRNGDTGVMARPGDYVDVIGVSGGLNEGRTARVLLQRILVLAVGNSLSADSLDVRSDSREGQLTLSVTLPEAQLLAVGLEGGSLSVALRGADDSQTAERVPDIRLSTFADPAARDQLLQGRQSAPVELRDPGKPGP